MNNLGWQKSLDVGFVESLLEIKETTEAQLKNLEIVHEHLQTLNTEEVLDGASKALKETRDQIQQILGSIEQLKMMASIQFEKGAEEVSCSVHEVLEQVLHSLQHDYPANQMTILKILPHDISQLPFAKEHLEVILFQLLFHARKAIANEARGLVTIEVDEKLFLSPENRRHRKFIVRVSDTGKGIPEEKLSSIFDPFNSSEIGAGEGVGLYIVKKLVELYGGTIRVESSSQGTSFYLEIPAHVEPTRP